MDSGRQQKASGSGLWPQNIKQNEKMLNDYRNAAIHKELHNHQQTDNLRAGL